MKKINALTAIVAVVVTAALSGVVASSASSSTVYGCVSKAGTLSKVSTKAHSCPKGTSKLTWGTTGAAGAAGTPGQAGSQGIQGDQGAQGVQGEVGPAGPGFEGPTAYSSYGSNSVTLTAAGATIVTLPPMPRGIYFLTATSTFRGGTGADSCWIHFEMPTFSNNILGADVAGQKSVALSGIFDPWEDGSIVSLRCSGDETSMNYESTITAIKVGALNPTN